MTFSSTFSPSLTTPERAGCIKTSSLLHYPRKIKFIHSFCCTDVLLTHLLPLMYYSRTYCPLKRTRRLGMLRSRFLLPLFHIQGHLRSGSCILSSAKQRTSRFILVNHPFITNRRAPSWKCTGAGSCVWTEPSCGFADKTCLETGRHLVFC